MDTPNESVPPREGRSHGTMLPLVLALVTLVLWFGFQASQLLAERDRLKQLDAEQQPIHANALRMRAQLDMIATGTARLARQGNANAEQVVQALAKKGVTIDLNATTGSTPAGQ